jgi:hypothetical protein
MAPPSPPPPPLPPPPPECPPPPPPADAYTEIEINSRRIKEKKYFGFK